MTAASASTTVGVNPDRRTRQAKKADHKHSAVSGAASHQPETCLVAARMAIAVNKTAPPRRRAIAVPSGQPVQGLVGWPPYPRTERPSAAREGLDLPTDEIGCRFHRTSMRQDDGTGNGNVSTFGPG